MMELPSYAEQVVYENYLKTCHPTTVSLTGRQIEFVKNNKINLSHEVRQMINDKIKKANTEMDKAYNKAKRQ